jgi:hypothetical protein
MNRLLTSIVLGSAITFPLAIHAKPSDNQRIEVPVKVQNDRFYLEVTVGSSGPIPVGIDTGAGGLRIWASNLKSSDVERTGISKTIMYGAGEQGLAGEIGLAKVMIGSFVLPGKTRIHYVTGHACRDEGTQKCDRLKEKESRFGFAGTLGLSTLAPGGVAGKQRKTDAVINPLLERGPFSYILKAPIGNEAGSLIINPTPAEKSRYLKLPLVDGSGQHVSFCINRYCGEAILDTGWGSSPFAPDKPKIRKELGLPFQDNRVVEGTKIPIKFGTGKSAVVIEATAGRHGSDVYMLKEGKEKEAGVLGFDTFRYIDVLYDYEAGVIGVAPKQ